LTNEQRRAAIRRIGELWDRQDAESVRELEALAALVEAEDNAHEQSVRFHTSDGTEICCRPIEYHEPDGPYACLRQRGHEPPCMAVAADAVEADGVCQWCRSPTGTMHSQTCKGEPQIH
jgi:hypothetical protein